MPRYYCDYCDTYLTHDSASVRKQHNAGYKHKANVRAYYQQFEEQQTQSFIDQKVKEHLGQTYQQQVGAAFHNVIQLGQYKPAVLPPLALAVPGTIPASGPPILQPLRPPVLPRPPGPPPVGYAIAPMLKPPGTPNVSPTAQPNGLPRPPTLLPPGTQVVTSSPAPGNGTLSVAAQSGPPGAPSNAFQQLQLSSSSPYGSFPCAAPPGSYVQQQPNMAPSPTSAAIPGFDAAASASLAISNSDSAQTPNPSLHASLLIPTSEPALSLGPRPESNYGYGQSLPGAGSIQATPSSFANSPELVTEL